MMYIFIWVVISTSSLACFHVHLTPWMNEKYVDHEAHTFNGWNPLDTLETKKFVQSLKENKREKEDSKIIREQIERVQIIILIFF